MSSAVETYIEAGLPDEAARVLMLRGDAEPNLERRMAFFQQAAQTAASQELARSAKARRARLSFDLVKQKGAIVSEIALAAAELEAAGEHLLAAEAYVLARDVEGEIRALTGAGAIDRLEERLQREAAASRTENERTLALRRIQDLDRGAERRAALRIAAESGEREERIIDLAREIRQRLARGPVCDFLLVGRPSSVAFGDSITLGRGDATLVVGSRALSRAHLSVYRDEAGEPWVRDLDTRNGTTLSGARLGAPIPVGGGLELELGGEVPCAIAPTERGAVSVTVAGATYLAPLGPWHVGPFRVRLEGKGGDDASFIVLDRELEHRAYRGKIALAPKIELCFGDEISTERGGPALLVVGHSGGTL